MRPLTRRRLGVLAAPLLLLAGCSSDDGDATKPKRTTTTVPDVAGKLTIAEQLPLDPQYDQLEALLDGTDVAAELDGGDDVTLLAPSSEAILALPAGRLDALRGDPVARTALLRRHLLKGKVDYLQLLSLGGKTVETVDGTQLAVEVVDTQVTIGGAPVTKHDIRAKNGLTHVLGGVVEAP